MKITKHRNIKTTIVEMMEIMAAAKEMYKN